MVVDGIIPGEIGKIELTFSKKNYWFGILIELQERSLKRAKPVCTVFKKCGGCSIQHIKSKYHMNLKSKMVMDAFTRIGHLSNLPEPYIHIPHEYLSYRNKTIIPVKRDNSNILSMGYFERNSHQIVNFDSCPILNRNITSSLPYIRRLLSLNYIPINDDSNHIKGLKHIGIRTSTFSNEIMIIFISNIDISLDLNKLANKLLVDIKNISGIINNIQPQNTNTIFGNTSNIVYGRKFIIEKFINIFIQLGVTSFFQVNLTEAEKAVNSIINNVSELDSRITILDLYCGIGTISLPLAKLGYKVIGIENNSESVYYANKNKVINNILNIEFILDDVNLLLEKYLHKKNYLILDPPRKGLTNLLINIILDKKPQNIAYLSCNPSTLARDLSLLKVGDTYSITSIETFDFFPQTMHVEVLVFLKLTKF